MYKFPKLTFRDKWAVQELTEHSSRILLWTATVPTGKHPIPLKPSYVHLRVPSPKGRHRGQYGYPYFIDVIYREDQSDPQRVISGIHKWEGRVAHVKTDYYHYVQPTIVDNALSAAAYLERKYG